MRNFIFFTLVVLLCVLLWSYFKPSDIVAPELIKDNSHLSSDDIKPIERNEPSPFNTFQENNESTGLQEKAVTLNNSDKEVIGFINKISPGLSGWLVPSELIRRFVMNVNTLSDGGLPNDFRLINKKIAPFKARLLGRNEQFYTDKKNYDRLMLFVDKVTEISAEYLVNFYIKHYGLFQKAYSELGLRGQFNNRLLALIDRITACPLPDETKKLKQDAVSYKYVDKYYEDSTLLRKALWRLGSSNVNKIKKYVGEVRSEIVANKVN